MTSEIQEYQVGDWIVHKYYGVGEIKDTEKRPIHGERVDCFRVKTKDAAYWLPIENADNDRVRRVANKSRLKKAISALKATPEKMAKNYRTRNARIKEIMFENGSLVKMAGLFRDLMALREKKKLNNTEKYAVDKIRERFIREYAVCKEVPLDEARTQFSKIELNQFGNA